MLKEYTNNATQTVDQKEIDKVIIELGDACELTLGSGRGSTEGPRHYNS